ncbi:hypothetical protein B9G69_015050 [Bdellovibrio sp. SKB1291214]|uniref:hypothetical protein n=1 Tax=Bdellovibrio sp. SKB1291214 TaxID=1732569 RepID=UPI000B51537F|nr:hypothetical protein [Bdellovibrio sp. SKB1291214]UYL08358.1 hypothetical protein B9G69_015050 [Bdellovibrio sp. SKB1291214]
MKSFPLTNFVLTSLLASAPAVAQEVKAKANPKVSSTSVIPFTGPNLNDVALDSQLLTNGSNSSTAILDIYVNCFGTNLRAVPNPIAESSDIFAKITYLTSTGTKTFEVKFPARATMNSAASTEEDLTSQTRVLIPATKETLTARLRGNLIRIKLTESRTIPVDVLATGTDFAKLTELAVKTEFLTNISFRQEVPAVLPANTEFMAYTGPVTAANNWYASENGKSIVMLASFPGENRFCGGYFSPLAFKFDGDDLPKVDKTSHFPLFRSKHKISWPSFKEDIYFLAVDKNKNGKVDDGAELFGDINNYQDGFKNLAAYDNNGDGVIDEKDSIFKLLLLWKDKNHDGKSSKDELKTMEQMGVTSISLTYDGTTQSAGPFAKLIGPGEFTYKLKSGEVKKGRVWDIFLKIVP